MSTIDRPTVLAVAVGSAAGLMGDIAPAAAGPGVKTGGAGSAARPARLCSRRLRSIWGLDRAEFARAGCEGDTRELRRSYGKEEIYTRWAIKALELWKQREQEWGNAHLFINYMLQPEVIAAVTNLVRDPNGNTAARQS
jgi:hypothetical protein